MFVPDALSFPSLRRNRAKLVTALVRLSAHPAAAAAALHLGPKLWSEIGVNARIHAAPVLPAIERYSGVLYDGIGVDTLPDSARAWVETHIVIASALFGLIRAGDPIPPYRLSVSATLPGLPLKAHWAAPVSSVLATSTEWMLDARSASYVALGPAPAGTAKLHVESEDSAGRRRALNHFNKHAKGELVRSLALSGAEITSRDDLLAWAPTAGVRLEPRGPYDVTLLTTP